MRKTLFSRYIKENRLTRLFLCYLVMQGKMSQFKTHLYYPEMATSKVTDIIIFLLCNSRNFYLWGRMRNDYIHL